MAKSYYTKRKMLGLCTRCGINKAQKEQIECKECSNNRNDKIKNLREERLKHGLCRCGKNKDSEKKYCEICLSKQRDRNKILRNEIFSHYGFCCKCCGECEDAFLSIDHVNGDGNYHRKQVNCKNGGTPFYSWLKKNNYPEGFQVLCMNCNFAKHKLGKCPHKYKKLDLP